MTTLTDTIEATLRNLAPNVVFLPDYDDVAAAIAANIEQTHTVRARRGNPGDVRMIGSPLDLVDGDPDHRASLEHHRSVRSAIEPTAYRDGPLHVLVGERQEGKTYLAERWLLDAPAGVERVLVAYSLDAAAEIKERIGLDRNDPRVISFHNLIGPGRSARPDVEYGFDETMRILEQLLRLKQPPHLVTITTASEWQGRDA